MAEAKEINVAGLSGPTHTFSGLSFGNLASIQNKQHISNPKAAALQSLALMHKLYSLGISQVLMPPQERPFLPILRAVGYSGSDAEVLHKAWKSDPQLLMACSSSSYMWTANAATTTPSSDAHDQRVHVTPANLISKFHRSFESLTTGMMLYRIFNHPLHFAHHPPLPFHPDFADEGAANHIRFCAQFGQIGVQLFVFGQASTEAQAYFPQSFPARQTEKASQALARLHRLDSTHVTFAQQHPEAIDQGVFHNDVIAVGNQNVFLYHEKAFINTSAVIARLRAQVESICHVPFITLEIKESELSITEAVKTYLFNSQLVTLPDQTMLLFAPQECQRSSAVQAVLTRLLQDQTHPIRQVLYQDVKESMQNGGGPACLRLRLILNKQEFACIHPSVLFNEERYHQLCNWVQKYYRDRLTPDDLADPQLLQEEQQALEALSRLLQLDYLYTFQRREPLPYIF